MTSEIKVDTISEQTSANGVTIDGLTIKDGNIIGDVALAGTTPTFTVGDGGAEDAALIFDGNAQDFYMALDDSADDLVIGTGSTIGSNVKMVIENGGNVGIGTASPDAKLHVLDSAASTATHSYTKLHIEDSDHLALQFSGGTGGEQWIWFADDSTSTPVGGITYYHGGPYMGFRVEGSERMRIDSSGNVGIGESSPASQLHITGATDAGGTISLKRPNTTVTAGQTLGAIEFITADSGSAGTAARILAEADGTGGEAKLVFNTGTGGSNSTRMIIDHDGNVGIGTTSIDVITQAGGSGFKVLQLENDEGGQINLDHNDAGTGSTLGMINFNRAGEVVAHISGVTDGATDSGQINFRTQPASGALTERMRITSTGLVGIGETSPLGLLHVKTSDSGATVNANRDDFVIENSGHCGMTILSGTSSVGGIGFGDSGGNLQGLMQYNHSTDNFEFNTNSSSNPLILHDTGQISSNGELDTNVDPGGLCLNTGANDGRTLSFKNSDIAHGMTTHAQTDTYYMIGKNSGTSGGAVQNVFSEDNGAKQTGFILISAMGNGYGGNNQLRASDAGAAIDLRGAEKGSGTAYEGLGGTGNILSIRGHSVVRFLFDANGDFHADNSSTTFDEYDDAQLARAYDLSHGKGVVNSKFDKFVAYNHEKLAELELVGREDDGTPNSFVNVTGMQRLHNGAIWQQYEKHQRLAEAVYEMAKEALGEDKADAILEKHDIKLLN